MPSISSLRRQYREWQSVRRFNAYSLRFRRGAQSLPAVWQRILDGLEEDGAYVTHLNALGLEFSTEMLTEVDQLFAAMPSVAEPSSYVLHASQTNIERCSYLLKWGLQEALLHLVEWYLGKPVAFRGVTVRKDLANGMMDGTRIWHRDGEDFRIVKCIIYINNVGQDGGGFQYIPRAHSPSTWRVDTHDGNRVVDMPKLVPESHWQSCVGPRGTVVFVDPCSIYLRGQLPKSAARQAVFFNYNSMSPLHPEHCQPLFNTEKFVASVALSPRQRAAVDLRY